VEGCYRRRFYLETCSCACWRPQWQGRAKGHQNSGASFKSEEKPCADGLWKFAPRKPNQFATFGTEEFYFRKRHIMRDRRRRRVWLLRFEVSSKVACATSTRELAPGRFNLFASAKTNPERESDK
jgi:hypothetical protein